MNYQIGALVKGGGLRKDDRLPQLFKTLDFKNLHFFQLRLSKPQPPKSQLAKKPKILHPNPNIQYQPHLHTLSLDMKMSIFLIRVGGFGCWLGIGREKGEGRREKGEGRREKGEGRREKGEGRREKGEGRREKGEE